MKISSEAKVGIIGIVALVMLIWGINYLKGKNILSSTYALHAYFEDTGGLDASSSILMNGVKIGYINEITLQPDAKNPIYILLSIEKEYAIRKGSRAVLVSTDLLGTKAIQIESANGTELAAEREFLMDNDTIPSAVEMDLLSSLEAQIMPVIYRIGDLAVSLDTLVQKLDTLLISQASYDILNDLSVISGSLRTTLEPGGTLNQSFSNLESFSSMLRAQEDEVAALTGHLNSISEAVDSAGLDKLSAELISLTQKFNLLLEQVNSGEGNAGKFFYSDSLYINLEMLTSDLDQLIKNLNENPQDYVHISLFGKSK